MAGGEGSARRRSARGVEAAASAPQATLRSCSTKRKAGNEAAASSRMPRSRASAAASASAEAEKAAGGKKNRMPAKDVRWILSQKPEAPPLCYQALKRRNPELVPRPGEEADEKLMTLYSVARTFYKAQERLPQLQDWVRSELKNKGYVEVDDDWFRNKAQAQAVIDREWPRIRAKMEELILMDEPSYLEEGGGESDDSDEEDGVDEDAALDSVMKDYNLY